MSEVPDLRLPGPLAVAIVNLLRALPPVQIYEAMTQLQPADAPAAAPDAAPAAASTAPD